MTRAFRKFAAATLICAPLLSACGEWQGSKDIDTYVGGADGIGHGPGLVTGKEGGIVIFNEGWGGAAPGGDAQE